MALEPLRDLEPRYDVKGGSPRTPVPPISQAEYQQYSVPVSNGNGVLKMIATAGWTAAVAMIVAWWTATQGKGVNQNEMQSYVREYMREYREGIAQHAASTDSQVGTLRGVQEQMNVRLSKVELQQTTDERDFTEFKTETKATNKLIADLLEQQKTKK